MEFKDMLKYLRMRSGLSQRDLASRLGISPSTVGMYEAGRREPDFEAEEKIADFFNVDLNTLRGKDVENSSPAAGTDLDPDEAKLLSDFRVLGDEGQAMLLSRAQELIKLGYTREEEAKKGVRS